MQRGGTNPFKELKTLFYLEIFLIEKPDIAHLITIKPYLYGGVASRITGVKSLVTTVSGLDLYLLEN